jgi:hypothetical protein
VPIHDDNFGSIERLVEFGLGVAVARQMVDSMNLALRNASMPGYHSPVSMPNRSCWVILGGKQAGPFDEAELSRLIVEGRLTKDSYVWKPGMPQWQTAENTPEVLRLVALAPPPFNAPE